MAFHSFLSRIIAGFCLLSGLNLSAQAAEATWFEDFKQTASDHELLHFLTAMPKGGDLHNHISGAVHSEWFWELALDAEKRGYRYYTKVRINNCRYGHNEYGGNPYLLLFRTISQVEYEALDDCERNEYAQVADLTGQLKTEWLESMRLDKPHEGRAEFFEALWPRVNSMLRNPYLNADMLVKNMQAFGAEGLLYMEVMIGVNGRVEADGTPIPPEKVAQIYRDRLKQPDALETGVTVRFQLAILRFISQAEVHLESVYRFVAEQPDFVGVNMVGREDNDKGYPLRFLPTLRKLRREIGDVRLAIHAGEVDEPNHHIRDTLLLGADRIGHGINLITDPETMLRMRHGPYLIEINLISNLLLEYVDDYSQHPFPEYLRTDIPVALSTDDRGMWDSTMTDEFFVAVKEFDLTWVEIRKLSVNSLQYAFLEEPKKQHLLYVLTQRLADFERRFKADGLNAFSDIKPQYRGFLCRHYQVCAPTTPNN